MKGDNNNSIKCDFFSNNATVNYQKIWVRFKISKDGNYKEDNKFNDADFEHPIENDNVYLCRKRNKDWLEMKIY